MILLRFMFIGLFGSLLCAELICEVFSFSLSEYLKVLILWFAEVIPGPTQAIIMIFDFSDLETKESLRTKVSLDALNGTWVSEPFFLASKALMHSFNASKLLLISAPSALRFLSFDWVSCALSEPFFFILFSFIF